MPSITLRNVPTEVHQGLRDLAAKHGRSTESEILEILAQSVQAERRVKLGSLLFDIGRSGNVSETELDSLNAIRGKIPSQGMSFE